MVMSASVKKASYASKHALAHTVPANKAPSADPGPGQQAVDGTIQHPAALHRVALERVDTEH